MKVRLQHALLPVTQLGMQACWLYAWLSLIELNSLGRTTVALAVAPFLVFGGLARAALQRLPLRRPLRIIGFWLLWPLLAAVAGKLVLYSGMPWGEVDWLYALPLAALRLIFETRTAELLLLFGSALAWYLGGRAVAHRPGHDTLVGQFQFGLLLLLGAFLMMHGLGISPGHPMLLALVYFALAISGIALTRSRREGTQDALPANRHFTGSLVTVIAVVSLLGLLAGIAITPDLIGMLIDAARFVLHALYSAFMFLISLLPEPDIGPGAEPDAPATGDDSALIEFYRALPWPALLRRVLFILWTVLVLGMMLFALWRLCGMVLDWLKRRSNMAGVEVESLDTGLLADLIALLLWLMHRGTDLMQRIRRILGRVTGTQEASSWSTVYAGLVRWAARNLRPRESGESATEYQSALSSLLPAASTDLASVTEVYTRARYGAHEPDNDAMEEMRQAIRRIRALPRPRKRSSENTIGEREQ
jgi:hypothetical protein